MVKVVAPFFVVCFTCLVSGDALDAPLENLRFRVRTYFQWAGRSGSNRAPRWTDFLAAHPQESSSSSGLPSLKVACKEFPRSSRSTSYMDCWTIHNPTNDTLSHCCTSYPGYEANITSCIGVSADYGVWEEMRQVIFYMPNAGDGVCVHQVLYSTDATTGDPAKRLHSHKHIRSAQASHSAPAGGAIKTGSTIDITFPDPWLLDGWELDSCLEDERGVCGQPVAERFCVNYKACQGLASHSLQPAPDSSEVSQIATDNSTSLGNPGKNVFKSITCQCTSYSDLFAPVLYRLPTVQPKYDTGTALDFCMTCAAGGGKGSECGQLVADAYCQLKQLGSTVSFAPSAFEGRTAAIGNLSVCTTAPRKTFEFIECAPAGH